MTSVFGHKRGRRKGDLVSPEDVANFFLHYAKQHGDLITHLKLQKLVYYAQAWHLAIQDKPLFEEDFEAWIHGPVLRSLYKLYANFRWEPIAPPGSVPDLPAEIESHLKDVYATFADFSAISLERMVHREAPWKEARGDLAPDEPGTQLISKVRMRDYYRELADESD